MGENRPLMMCGHTAQGTDAETGEPVCVICVGAIPGAEIVNENAPSLEGRQARCVYCRKEVDSSCALPFFEHRPDWEYDRYYCGCWGWD